MKAGEVSEILGGVSQLFSTPERAGTVSNQLTGSVQNTPTRTPSETPKIDVLKKTVIPLKSVILVN